MEKYFYAKEKASIYDETIESVVPNYSLMLNTVFNFIDTVFDDEGEIKIQDIGTGTGNESLPILKSFEEAKLFACDLNEDMKRVFEFNAKKENVLANRYNFIVDDYLNINYEKLCFDLSISGYCIHHYPFEEKMLFFKKIYSELKTGGYFILIDIVNYESDIISRYCHNYDINFIEKSFNKLSEKSNFKEKVNFSSMKDEWIHHMENENILDTAKKQIKGLFSVGFNEVECIYTYLQHSIIIAKK